MRRYIRHRLRRILPLIFQKFIFHVANQGIFRLNLAPGFHLFGEDVNVYTILSATTSRTYLIDRIMEEAAACGMDGINIDFENITAGW